jgi:hypothetical protein
MMPNEKLQGPSSNFQRSPNHQNTLTSQNFGDCYLELLWTLVLGFWSFPPRVSSMDSLSHPS